MGATCCCLCREKEVKALKEDEWSRDLSQTRKEFMKGEASACTSSNIRSDNKSLNSTAAHGVHNHSISPANRDGGTGTPFQAILEDIDDMDDCEVVVQNSSRGSFVKHVCNTEQQEEDSDEEEKRDRERLLFGGSNFVGSSTSVKRVDSSATSDLQVHRVSETGAHLGQYS